MPNARAVSEILLPATLRAWTMALRSTASSERITVASIGILVEAGNRLVLEAEGGFVVATGLLSETNSTFNDVFEFEHGAEEFMLHQHW